MTSSMSSAAESSTPCDDSARLPSRGGVGIRCGIGAPPRLSEAANKSCTDGRARDDEPAAPDAPGILRRPCTATGDVSSSASPTASGISGKSATSSVIVLPVTRDTAWPDVSWLLRRLRSALLSLTLRRCDGRRKPTPPMPAISPVPVPGRGFVRGCLAGAPFRTRPPRTLPDVDCSFPLRPSRGPALLTDDGVLLPPPPPPPAPPNPPRPDTARPLTSSSSAASRDPPPSRAPPLAPVLPPPPPLLPPAPVPPALSFPLSRDADDARMESDSRPDGGMPEDPRLSRSDLAFSRAAALRDAISTSSGGRSRPAAMALACTTCEHRICRTVGRVL
mmetsp:Transcript_15367/g.53384  ORF Transcript_15367/g.53384 Transcript_15367/m.53384 type:complete len:334 (+) Transcript_15367:938-1939(+)